MDQRITMYGIHSTRNMFGRSHCKQSFADMYRTSLWAAGRFQAQFLRVPAFRIRLSIFCNHRASSQITTSVCCMPCRSARSVRVHLAEKRLRFHLRPNRVNHHRFCRMGLRLTQRVDSFNPVARRDSIKGIDRLPRDRVTALKFLSPKGETVFADHATSTPISQSSRARSYPDGRTQAWESERSFSIFSTMPILDSRILEHPAPRLARSSVWNSHPPAFWEA